MRHQLDAAFARVARQLARLRNEEVTTDYLRLTGREAQAELVEAYFKAQGLWYVAGGADPVYSSSLGLDLSAVEPSLAGPARPQDRVALSQTRESYRKAVPGYYPKAAESPEALLAKTAQVKDPRKPYPLAQGSVVIAAITSCTNTSNPAVLMAAGLLAQKAAARGLRSKPWVKTSLAPGSKVVTDYLRESGTLGALEQLGFHLVGYGCTTCIGNSGPLPEAIAAAITEGDLAVAAVLSGNRNFEGRVHPQVRSNYLASPPLCVAFALAGTIDIDLTREPLGTGSDGKPVFLKDVWPTPEEVASAIVRHVTQAQFKKSYSDVFRGDSRWQSIQVPAGELYKWDPASTYIKEPPYFEGMKLRPEAVAEIRGARVLAFLGDSITTDHISPAGNIARKSPAGEYLVKLGVKPEDFNSYGARRGNHEVMVRGTFANIRLKNLLVPGVEGGVTRHLPSGKEMPIYDAAMQYVEGGVPTIILAGKEYGSGSSRDWAAKGPLLLGVRAVIVESFERIHRSNLVGMGILPLQFLPGESAKSLGLTGEEVFEISGLATVGIGLEVLVRAKRADGSVKEFKTRSRIDTPNEAEYFRNGGILPYVLRQSLGANV